MGGSGYAIRCQNGTGGSERRGTQAGDLCLAAGVGDRSDEDPAGATGDHEQDRVPVPQSRPVEAAFEGAAPLLEAGAGSRPQVAVHIAADVAVDGVADHARAYELAHMITVRRRYRWPASLVGAETAADASWS